jgi:hypothetical protein
VKARDFVRAWLAAPPLAGIRATLFALSALAVPTIIRASLENFVSEAGFIIYIPFLLLSALSLKWWQAAALALLSAITGDFLFVGPPFQLLETANDRFGTAVFLVSSAMIIAIGYLIKRVVSDPLWLNGPSDNSSSVVFSLERGQAKVSWYGARTFVHLGPEQEVAEMMKDFLDQRELAKRFEE